MAGEEQCPKTSVGIPWKLIVGLGALCISVGLVIAGANRNWGGQREKVAQLESRVGNVEKTVDGNRTSIARVEVAQQHMKETLTRIENKLDRIVEASR